MGDIGKLAVSVVGGFVGNLLGSLFAPISKQEGPRLDDLTLPKSEYGKSIPKVYGTAKVTGNLMWGRPIKEKTEKISSGTFKASVEQTKYYYYGTAAWLLCEGSVILKKVWANGKLLYNSDSGTGQSAAGSETWAKYFTFFNGVQTSPSAVIESFEGVGRVPDFKGKSYIVFNELPLEIFGNRLPEISCEVQGNLQPALKDVLFDICKRAGIAELDIDVSQITGNIDGFIMPNNGETYRDLLEELGQVYFFYAYQEENKIRFRHYQRPGSITSIPVGDLATRESDSARGENYLQRKRFGSELPSNVSLTFNNKYANYEQDTQNAFRSTNIESLQRIHQNDEKVQTNASLSRTDAFISAHRILHQIWATRTTYENITLPPKWINALAPGEVVSLPTGNNPYTFVPIQITDVEIGANLIVSAKAQLYDGNIPAQTLEVEIDESVNTNDEVFSNNWNGSGTVVLLDIPGVLTSDYVAYIGVYSDTPEYSSADIYFSVDNVNFEFLTSVSNQIIHGIATNALNDAITTELIDKKNTLTITTNKPINSVTEAEFLNYKNLLLIGKEIIAFKNAVLIGENTYRLSYFIRGLFYTEPYTDEHLAEEKIYIINNDFQPLTNIPLGNSRYYRSLSAYDSIEFIDSISATWTGKSAECYTVSHLKVYLYLSRFNIQWKRRTRGTSDFDNPTPLNEAYEAYRLYFVIWNANSFRKTLTITQSYFDYTVNDLINDGIFKNDDFYYLDDNNLIILDDSNRPIEISNYNFSFNFTVGVAQNSDFVTLKRVDNISFTWNGEIVNTNYQPYADNLLLSLNSKTISSSDTSLTLSGTASYIPISLNLRLNNISYSFIVNEDNSNSINGYYEWSQSLILNNQEPLPIGVYFMEIGATLANQSPVLNASSTNLLTVI